MSKVHPADDKSTQPQMTTQEVVMQPQMLEQPQMAMQPQLLAQPQTAMQPPMVAQPHMVAAQPQMVAQPQMAMTPSVQAQPSAVNPPGTFQGYAISGFDEVAFMSPPSYQYATRSPPSRQEIAKPREISKDEAITALANHVSEHCCYGKKPLVEMKIYDLKTSSGYHYTLETFTENRSACWAYEPFIGQDIDGPQNGPTPGPWDIQAHISQEFCNETVAVEVPHTASVERCPECFATGKVRCISCNGTGKTTCWSCRGRGTKKRKYSDGTYYRYPCNSCGGSGKIACGCMDGMVFCPMCNGKAQLKVYIKLTIEWTNYVLESLIEKSTNLPNVKLKTVSGNVAFEETLPRVQPIEHCEEIEVNNDSHKLIQKHMFTDCRILKQRHKLRVIPVTKCIFKWRESPSDYVVYGLESHVYAPNYPQQCCWGCTIL